MRIVQISPYDLSRHGGVQQHIKSLAKALRERGHDVLTIGPGQGSSEEYLGIGRKRKISFIGTSFELSRAAPDELKALANRLAVCRPDIMHYHTMWVPMLPWQIFRQTKVASVATFHDTPPPGATGAVLRSVFKTISRPLLNRIDGAIAVSTAPLAHLRPGANGCRPVVLPPATDLTDFLAIEKREHAARQTVLYFGRLEPRKGIDILISAWDRIANDVEPLPPGLMKPRLVIAGNGELEPLVTAAAERLGHDLLQHVPAPHDAQLRSLLSEASIAVAPALHGESFGIVLVEALASGTPVIAAANSGYVHVMTGQGRDLLVPPGDAQALAARVVSLLANAGERKSLAVWGRQHARQFDIAVVAPKIEAVYQAAQSRFRRSKEQASGNQVSS